jgi:hypothetical protein
MLARDQWTKPSLEDFIAWLETKLRNEKYNWHDNRVCPCGQYAASIGEKDWTNNMNNMWRTLNSLAYSQPRTYGGLLARVLDYKLYHSKSTGLQTLPE